MIQQARLWACTGLWTGVRVLKGETAREALQEYAREAGLRGWADLAAREPGPARWAVRFERRVYRQDGTRGIDDGWVDYSTQGEGREIQRQEVHADRLPWRWRRLRGYGAWVYGEAHPGALATTAWAAPDGLGRPVDGERE